MKYRNKFTGTIVEPPSDLAAQAFSKDPWEEMGDSPSGDPLEALTVKQIEAQAEEIGVDLSGCKNKAEKLAVLKAALAGGGEPNGDPAGS
ncbi:MAG: hypothetical protein AAGU02_04760 [Lawsonibacter sp.]